MTQQEENNLSILNISGFSDISEIPNLELDEINKYIDFDIESEFTLDELEIVNSVIDGDFDDAFISSSQ